MAVKKKKRSTLKRIRQTARRTVQKGEGRSLARTAVRRARQAIAAGGDGATEAIRAATSALDKATKRGAMHKNQARRKRSRLARAAAKAAKTT